VRGDDACRRRSAGLKLFAPSSPAAALTAVAALAGTDSTAICKRFREQFGAVVANGQAEMKGQLFRIAHIGYYDYLDTVGVLAALEHVIAEATGRRLSSDARCARRRKSMRKPVARSLASALFNF